MTNEYPGYNIGFRVNVLAHKQNGREFADNIFKCIQENMAIFIKNLF